MRKVYVAGIVASGVSIGVSLGYLHGISYEQRDYEVQYSHEGQSSRRYSLEQRESLQDISSSLTNDPIGVFTCTGAATGLVGAGLAILVSSLIVSGRHPNEKICDLSKRKSREY